MAVTKKAGARAAAVRKAHAAKVHASPAWAAKKAKVKATHAAKVKAQAAVKRTTGGSGYSGPSQPPKGFTTPPPPIGRTSPGTGGSPIAPGSANRARQGAVTGAVKRMGGDRIGAGVRSKGVAYKKPTKVKKIRV